MFDHLVLRKSSKIVKSFQMSRQWSALDCIRCDSASIVRALRLALLLSQHCHYC